MKHVGVKTSLLSAFTLAAVGFTGVSFGHTVSGRNLASSSVMNVEVFQVLCNNSAAGGGNGLNPLRFVGRVNKAATATANSMRISLGRVGTLGTGATASTASTTAAASSAFAQLASGNNVTHVAVVGHSTAISNNFSADLHCESVAVGGLPAPNDPTVETGTTILGGTIGGGGSPAPIINQ
jgi:hypothetical protein